MKSGVNGVLGAYWLIHVTITAYNLNQIDKPLIIKAKINHPEETIILCLRNRTATSKDAKNGLLSRFDSTFSKSDASGDFQLTPM